MRKKGGSCTVCLSHGTSNILLIAGFNYKKVKGSNYRPGVAQSVGRGIALLLHDRGTRKGWVVSSTLRLHFTPGKDPALILQEAGWAPGQVWAGGKSRPHRDSISNRPAPSSVAIATELPGPQGLIYTELIPKKVCDRTSEFEWKNHRGCVRTWRIFQVEIFDILETPRDTVDSRIFRDGTLCRLISCSRICLRLHYQTVFLDCW